VNGKFFDDASGESSSGIYCIQSAKILGIAQAFPQECSMLGMQALPPNLFQMYLWYAMVECRSHLLPGGICPLKLDRELCTMDHVVLVVMLCYEGYIFFSRACSSHTPQADRKYFCSAQL